MKTLLIIDRTLPIEIAPLLDEYAAAIGPDTQRVFVDKANNKDPKAHIKIAAEITWPFVKSGGERIQVIGDVPMPYSGLQGLNPDGHSDTAGAYACPGYYVAPYTNWTDVGTYAAPRAVRANFPDDGKFDQASYAPAAQIGWLNLSRLNPKTFGSTLTGINWVAHCYSKYFARNFAYRRGELVPKTRLGQGFAQGNGTDWLHQIDTNLNVWGRDVNLALSKAPYLVSTDFKSLDSRITQMFDPFTILYLSYGSYQIDYLAATITNPLYAAALAVGSMGPNWNLRLLNQPNLTVGKLWLDSVKGVFGFNTVPALYGDCTLSLS